jgi:hypothetical protein
MIDIQCAVGHDSVSDPWRIVHEGTNSGNVMKFRVNYLFQSEFCNY